MRLQNQQNGPSACTPACELGVGAGLGHSCLGQGGGWYWTLANPGSLLPLGLQVKLPHQDHLRSEGYFGMYRGEAGRGRRAWMDSGDAPRGGWLQLHPGWVWGRAVLSAVLHHCRHPAWQDLLPGQVGHCSAPGHSRGRGVPDYQKAHLDNTAWLPDAVQLSPCTERGSTLPPQLWRTPRLDTAAPRPHLCIAEVFLMEAHPLDREGRLEEDALPPPWAQMWGEKAGEGAAKARGGRGEALPTESKRPPRAPARPLGHPRATQRPP